MFPIFQCTVRISPRFDSASDGRSETFQMPENGDQNETYRSSQPVDPMTSGKPMLEKETENEIQRGIYL